MKKCYRCGLLKDSAKKGRRRNGTTWHLCAECVSQQETYRGKQALARDKKPYDEVRRFSG